METAQIQLDRKRYEEELAALDKRAAAVRSILVALKQLEPTDYPPRVFPRLGESKLKLTPAILRVVEGCPPGRTLKTADIRGNLFAMGYSPTSKSFNITLMKTLGRLVKSGRINGTKSGQYWHYSNCTQLTFDDNSKSARRERAARH